MSSTQTLYTEGWNSEIQQFRAGGIESWGANIRLHGRPADGCEVLNCTLAFEKVAERRRMAHYEPSDKRIWIYFCYEDYPAVLHYLQTSKGVGVHFDEGANSVTAFLYNADTVVPESAGHKDATANNALAM